MKTFLKIIFLFIVLIFVVSFFTIKYFFSGSPRDLGVIFTEADRATAYTNNGVESLSISPDPDKPGGISYEGKKEIKTSFTSAEITALNNSVKWVNYPISRLQIKINPDGTGEASGILDVQKILKWISFTHPVAEIQSKVNEYKIGLNPPFYLKGSVTVVNNKVTLIPQIIEIGRVVIPQNIISENIIPVEKFAQDRLNSIPNLNIKSLDLTGGRVNLDATYPERELTVQQ
jgi:hypothetical protein